MKTLAASVVGVLLAFAPASVWSDSVPDWIERLGWTLVHSVWLLAVVAIIAAIMDRALGRRSADARYLVGVTALGLMIALPCVTWTLIAVEPHRSPTAMASVPDVSPLRDAAPIEVWNGHDAESPHPARRGGSRDSALQEANGTSSRAESHEPQGQAQWGEDKDQLWPPILAWIRAAIEPRLLWLVALWIAGVALCSLRPAWGLWTQWRLRRVGLSPVSEPLQRMLLDLAQRMRLARVVRIAESTFVRVPMVVGYLRPMILLPASVLTGLTPTQLEAVLAHELAHVRRHDWLVNALQVLAETLLFFHPAVWWLSNRIRHERELCCDDCALSLINDKAVFARTLLILEELRQSPFTPALAATGGDLAHRVRRLLPTGQVSSQPKHGAGATVLVTLCLSLALLFGVSLASRKTSATESPPRAGRGSPDPALDPTAGLPNSDEETNPTNNANGDLRSNPAAGSGDPRRVQQEPPSPKAGEKLDAGAERRLKWGEPVNGLRAAMCIQSVTDAAGDQKPDVFMAIQNVSEAPIHLVASAEFPNPRNGVLSGRGLPQSRQMIAEPMPMDVLLQPRQVTFMLWIERAAPDSNRVDGRSHARILIWNTVETLTGTMAIDKAPPGAWTGKLVTGDTSGADAMVSLQPKGKEAQSLFKKWQNGSRANGNIPGGALGPLVRVMTNFIKNNPTHEGAPKFAELLKRIDTARDWPPAAAVTLLDEVSAIYPSLPEWVEGENRFKLGGDVVAGKPLPEELKNAPWGEAQPNGLRVAWLLEPRALKYRLNTPLKSRLLFHNSGKNAVVFRALTWNQSGGHKARDAQGAEINIMSVEWTTIPMVFACRLAPGEFLEVIAAGIGVGANKDDEDWRDARSQVRVGAWIEAKAGDEVTFLPDAVHCDARDAGQPEGEEVATPKNWWSKFIANRLSLDAPLPADAAERKRLLDRATRDLFGNAPTPEEITAFTTDAAPDALDALAKRLASRPGFETFSGSLKSGTRKFLVLPVDPEAAKKPRTAKNPGQYPLGGNATFVVTRRPIGERIVNEAHLSFSPTDATKPAPREPHPVPLPDNYDSWIAAWMRGGTVLWVAQKGADQKPSIRRYDFTNPASVTETVIKELKPSEALPQPILDVLVPDAAGVRAGRGSPDPALDPTAGLQNSNEETNPTNNANGDLPSNPATGSGDPRPALSEKFTAELPNGVRVEFVGLAAMESEAKTWWKPDGTPLDEVPKHGKQTITVSGQEVRRALLRVHGDKLNFEDVTAPGMTNVLLAESPPSLLAKALGSSEPFIRIGGGYAFPPGQKTGRFEVGIATQPQSPARYLNAKGQRVAFVRRANVAGRSPGTLVVGGIDKLGGRPLLVDAAGGSEPATVEIGELKTINDGFAEDIEVLSVATPPLREPVTVNVNGRPVLSPENESDNKVLSQQTQITWRAPNVPKPMNLELILIDVHGKQHRHTSLGGGRIENRSPDGIPHWGDFERFFRFDVPISRVAGFEYRVRPYQHWVTFDNVALNPGEMTDVKVKVQSQPEPKPRAGRGSPDPALDPTAGLSNSDKDTKSANNANGDLRSKPAAGSGDPRPAQDVVQAVPPLLEFRFAAQRPDSKFEPRVPADFEKRTYPHNTAIGRMIVEDKGFVWVGVFESEEVIPALPVERPLKSQVREALLADTPEHTLPFNGKWSVEECRVVPDPNGGDRFGIELKLNEAGGAALRTLTKSHLNQPLAILVNNKIIAAPIVRSEIGRDIAITGNFTREQADRLAKALSLRPQAAPGF